MLSFNLISCLEDIDNDIVVKHKEKFVQNTFNMDNNRFKQMNKQKRKMTKYEKEYMEKVATQRVSPAKKLKVSMIRSKSKESLKRNYEN